MGWVVDRRTGPDDEYVVLGQLIGQFHRRTQRMYQRMSFDPPLERAAYTLLARLVGAGPARLTALAEDLALDLSTVSRQAGALQTAGLASRSPDPADRRAWVIAATETGREAFARHRRSWVGALRELLADWTPEERREFVRLFTRLNDSIAVPYGGSDPAGVRPRAREEETQ
ncbi:DNA-binding transcriptional regulator, MarR family [Micromonospora pattaloongensis]|uniref:DNA-binding transcriptional regulator, MarR family n=1 Tax=Micromonospora pattaloongensis TaxID=405436 RepID=A0A1H3SLP5_9ACTN|nr:MarR family winged helix-turn-helix transcriptional regulator [Micromonospora pattaloongensis]SDZ38864.1 DNA-binding transcriptional regulator, MarR family [Micromonospora pattaloongensis]